MISVTFSGPPTTPKNATLYQHGLEVMRVVSRAKETLESLDNQEPIDINRAPGQVVVDTPYPLDQLTPDLVGAYRKTPVHYLTGQISDGEMKASLTAGKSREYYDPVAIYHETAAERIYQLNSPGSEHYDFHPGNITVRQDKAGGTMTVEQAQDFPWDLHFTYSNITAEGIFPPTGPTSTDEAPLYHLGERLKSQVDDQIERMKNRDNAPGDLSPQPGLVILPGYGTTNSDNLVYGHMAGDYKIPLEARLEFDPSSGKVQDFSAGFGDKSTLTYHRDPVTGLESYRRDVFLGCASLDIQPDGQRVVRHYEQTKTNFDSPLYRQEHSVSDPGLPGYWQTRDVDSLVCGGLLGGIVASLAAGAAGLAPGPVAAAAVAGALLGGLGSQLSLKKQVELKSGVNRFEGPDQESRFAAAQYAFEHRYVSEQARAPHHFDFGSEGVSREKCLEVIERCQRTPAYGQLAILTRQLGEKGEPAVVLIPTDFSYPVRNGETGLILPGDVTIPYAAIRGITDYTE